MNQAVSPTRLFFGLILPLSAAVMLGNLGGWDLWNPDEPRYAQVAREMLATGQYVVPHLNAEPYPDKPPLFFWLVALCSRFFGDVTAYAARLPAAMAALGVVTLTFFLGMRIADPLTALLATVILVTSEQFFTVSISAHLDPLLTLLTTASIMLLQSGYTRLPAGTPFFLAAYACMGLALLTKGPVGLLVPLISFLLYLVLTKEWRFIRHLHIGKGLVLAAGMLSLWLVPACLMGGDAYTQNILFKQTFGRTIESYSHQNPFYYYLIEFPVDFFPWSVFIPSACLYYWKRRERLRDMCLPLAWFAGTFLFFSSMSCKRSLYLLPLYPAAALLMARLWADWLRSPPQRMVTVPFKVLCWLLAGFGTVGAGLFVFDIAVIRPIQHHAMAFYTLCIVLVCAGLAGLWLCRFNRSVYFFGHVAASTAVIFVLIVTIIFPAINSIKSGRFFCERIARHLGPGDRLVATFEPELFNYFLRRWPIPVLQQDKDLVSELLAPRKTYAITRARKNLTLPNELRDSVTVLEQQQIGHRNYFLLTNKTITPPIPHPTAFP
ncbi:MAG: glycosyltransferase family 39 protein [Desulfobacterota bacterium]|nr:glycosyltransferase family 39 protein [Thermodesulfobacteriota bacterium]